MNKTFDDFRKICQEGGVGGGKLKDTLIDNYPDWIMRKFSIIFTLFFVKINITANQVSSLSIVLGIISAFLFMKGTYTYYLLASLFLFLWFVLDHSDGEVARYKKQKSNLGHFLDKMMHSVIHPLVFLGIGFGLYNSSENLYWLIFGIISSFCLFLIDLTNLNKLETQVSKNLVEKDKIKTYKKFFKFNFIYQFQWIFIFIIIASFFNLLSYLLVLYTFVFVSKAMISFLNTIIYVKNLK